MRPPLVLLAIGAAEQIRTASLESHDGYETGGILLGHDRHGILTVTVAGGPGPRATRTPTSFARDVEHAERLAVEAFAADESVWIGEWHTHPHAPPIPSETDVRTYTSLLSDASIGFDRILAILVVPATNDEWANPIVHAYQIALHVHTPRVVTVTPCDLRLTSWQRRLSTTSDQ